jgi:predicted permease
VTLSGGESPERLDAARVGADFFDVLGVPPLLGRTFSAAEAQVGGPQAVILGHGLWQRRFGGDRAVLGRLLTIEGESYQVVGVAPRSVTYPDDAELWLPLVFEPRDLEPRQRGAHYLSVVGRLKPGINRAAAEADIAAIEQRIAAEHARVQGYGIWLQPVFESIVGQYRRPLWMLFGAVVFVLLIGCANISNLLLSRAVARRTELGIRTALGAGRWRIVRQLLVESTLLAVVGGAAGLLLAAWSSRALAALVPLDVPRLDGIAIDSRVLLMTLFVSLVAGLLFGLAPAIEASRGDLITSLKEARREGAGVSRRAVRHTLVAAQVALALVLLAGAGLAVRSFDRLTSVDTGFDPRGTLAFGLSLPSARYSDAASIAGFYRDYVGALAAQPGVSSVGAVARPPLARGGFGGSFTLIGRPEPPDEPSMAVRAATPGYLETVRIPLRRGRTIVAADTASAPHVAVISEAAARQYWPGEDPIGQRIRIHVSTGTREREREIVGVVGDVRAGRIELAPAPLVYVPHAQYPFDTMTVFVRTTGEPVRLAPMVRTQLASIDRDVAIGRMRPGEALVDDAVAQPRFRMRLLAFFAATALGLAALGLYGVMAFGVNQRRGEIGLRLALGADRAAVIGLVLRQGLTPVVVGLGAGLAGALVLTRAMRGLLYEVTPFDPWTFAAVSLLLATVAALACYVPARRAAAVDPLIALRSE